MRHCQPAGICRSVFLILCIGVWSAAAAAATSVKSWQSTLDTSSHASSSAQVLDHLTPTLNFSTDAIVYPRCNVTECSEQQTSRKLEKRVSGFDYIRLWSMMMQSRTGPQTVRDATSKFLHNLEDPGEQSATENGYLASTC